MFLCKDSCLCVLLLDWRCFLKGALLISGVFMSLRGGVTVGVKLFKLFDGGGGRALSGNLRGAGRDIFKGLTHTITNGSAMSSSILSSLRRILVASSMNIRAAIGVVQHVRRHITESGCISASRLGEVLERRVTDLLRRGRASSGRG